MRNTFLLGLVLWSLPLAAAAADIDCTLLEKKVWEKVFPGEIFDPGKCDCKPDPDEVTQAIVVADRRLAAAEVVLLLGASGISLFVGAPG